MPIPLFPPLTPGGETIPRQLNRWLDKSFQGGPLTRTETFITLPNFAVNVTWNGYSDIVAAFNFEGPNNFSLMPFVAPTNPNYALCISYIYQGVLTRYLMWNATGSNLNQVIPLYTGQPIKKNFRFEIWSTSQGNVSQSATITFYTSVAGDLDYRFGQDLALVNNDPEVTNFMCNAFANGYQLNYTFASAGSANANGAYTLSSASTNNGQPVPFYLNTTNAGEIQFLPNTGTFNVVDISSGLSLYAAPLYQSYTDLTTVVWNLITGSNPTPTVTHSNPQVITYIFALPMIFPTNSTSTPN